MDTQEAADLARLVRARVKRIYRELDDLRRLTAALEDTIAQLETDKETPYERVAQAH